MGKRLSTLHHLPQTLAQLINELQDAWNEVLQADVRSEEALSLIYELCTVRG